MYIAFSALGQQSINEAGQINAEVLEDNEAVLRFKAYQAACDKYRDEIRAIQKYMPGWIPAFNR
ncbi:hypothetical protein AAFN85_29235 [Mucilaginibacter sp. CAU 1740]|uniref:hypothetical protein n=1 Tax=Mucilaginibacter sp. CAU 1740 TaxID=3140365 RepID=UPI00325A6B47